MKPTIIVFMFVLKDVDTLAIICKTRGNLFASHAGSRASLISTLIPQTTCTRHMIKIFSRSGCSTLYLGHVTTNPFITFKSMNCPNLIRLLPIFCISKLLLQLCNFKMLHTHPHQLDVWDPGRLYCPDHQHGPLEFEQLEASSTASRWIPSNKWCTVCSEAPKQSGHIPEDMWTVKAFKAFWPKAQTLDVCLQRKLRDVELNNWHSQSVTETSTAYYHII